MSLAKLAPRTKVSVPDGEGGFETFSVRGLSLADIRALMLEDGGTVIAELYQQAIASVTLQDGDATAGLFADILEQVPELVAKAIARALGEPDAWEQIMEASVGVQMDLLEATYTQTFHSERAAKKVWETVSKYVGKRLKSPPSDSKTGFGG